MTPVLFARSPAGEIPPLHQLTETAEDHLHMMPPYFHAGTCADKEEASLGMWAVVRRLWKDRGSP